ncbi:hypothetical protein DENSPDRAFT_883876 [Dentipellis sp. KUC8613]|nr:hypothetical protein DENSPDRAFT_883876 [Dentipellis sp. KUC8613]
MCCIRRVRNIYTGCGHAQDLPEQFVQCLNEKCKLSPRHPPYCQGDACKAGCWQ